MPVAARAHRFRHHPGSSDPRQGLMRDCCGGRVLRWRGARDRAAEPTMNAIAGDLRFAVAKRKRDAVDHGSRCSSAAATSFVSRPLSLRRDGRAPVVLPAQRGERLRAWSAARGGQMREACVQVAGITATATISSSWRPAGTWRVGAPAASAPLPCCGLCGGSRGSHQPRVRLFRCDAMRRSPEQLLGERLGDPGFVLVRCPAPVVDKLAVDLRQRERGDDRCGLRDR